MVPARALERVQVADVERAVPAAVLEPVVPAPKYCDDNPEPSAYSRNYNCVALSEASVFLQDAELAAVQFLVV